MRENDGRPMRQLCQNAASGGQAFIRIIGD
jgi:hypothetical protein